MLAATLLLTAVIASAAPQPNFVSRALHLEARQGLSSLLPEACATQCATLNTAYGGCHTGDMTTCLSMCEPSKWAEVESCMTCAIDAGAFDAGRGAALSGQLSQLCDNAEASGVAPTGEATSTEGSEQPAATSTEGSDQTAATSTEDAAPTTTEEAAPSSQVEEVVPTSATTEESVAPVSTASPIASTSGAAAPSPAVPSTSGASKAPTPSVSATSSRSAAPAGSSTPAPSTTPTGGAATISGSVAAVVAVVLCATAFF